MIFLFMKTPGNVKPSVTDMEKLLLEEIYQQ